MVKRPVIVKERRKVQKTGMKKEKLKRKKSDSNTPLAKATNNNKLVRKASGKKMGCTFNSLQDSYIS